MRATKPALFHSRPSPWFPQNPRSFVADRTSFAFAPPPLAVETNADKRSLITRGTARQRAHNQWQRLINHELTEWALDPARFDDDGIEPPSRQIIRFSDCLGGRFRDEGLPAPDSVVPDPNGGIVFERRENGLSEVLHVWDDGTVEHQLFRGTRLVEGETLQFDPSANLTRWTRAWMMEPNRLQMRNCCTGVFQASMPWYSPGAELNSQAFDTR